MPVLLLARGDSTAKDLLRSAIESRYGFRPPALATLELDFKGRAHGKVGPLWSWFPIELTTRLKFPLSVHLEYSVRPLGLPVRKGEQAYDGMVFRRLDGGEPNVVTDPDEIHSLQKRLWAIAAVLLTPLTEHFVELHSTGEHSLEATNRETDDTVQIFLNEDNTISHVQTMAYNPTEEEEQLFKLVLSGGHITLDELILPAKITAYWDDDAAFEVEPVSVKINPEIPEAAFVMAE